MQPMTIRHNRPLAILLIVIGPLLVLVNMLQGSWLAVAGIPLVLLGILMLMNPSIKIRDGELLVCSPAGFVARRYPVQSPADLAFDGKKLYHRPTDKKIMTLSTNAHQADVEELRALVEHPFAQQPQPGRPPQAPPAQPPSGQQQGQFPVPPADANQPLAQPPQPNPGQPPQAPPAQPPQG